MNESISETQRREKPESHGAPSSHVYQLVRERMMCSPAYRCRGIRRRPRATHDFIVRLLPNWERSIALVH